MTLRAILGNYAVVAHKSLLIKQKNGNDPHPTNIDALANKRWASVSELDANTNLDSAGLKQLTGGDTVTARGMSKDFREIGSGPNAGHKRSR